MRDAGNARGQRRASGAVQSFSNNNASDLLGKFPRGLRLRASLRVSLRMNLAPVCQEVLGIAVN